ncbi:hypothetical protein ACHHYP_09348 [Achlya hypogyna]|uniref:Uncharacterized protein n=1 Tax=Achlya hypogyna TaxID=1202772 RepID=A0A1V9YNH4_ACHHY|nr:hypothetical protein ACHHYP_09348 [Achlya hypogyna]
MCRSVSKIVLIGLNVVFVVAGALLIYVGAAVSPGWANVYSSASNGSSSTTFNLIIAFGVVVLLIALMGLIGTIKRSKCLLCTYGIFVVLALAIFLLIMVTGFFGAATANSWAEQSFPANNHEVDVSHAFDTAYCAVMFQHYCVGGTLTDAISILSPAASSSVTAMAAALNVDTSGTAGLKDFCVGLNSTSAGAVIRSNTPNLEDVCHACEEAAKYDFSELYEWGEKHCPFSTVTAAWCTSYFSTNKYPSPDKVYPECRPAALSLFHDFATKVAIGALVFSVAAFAVVVMICITARSPSGGGSSA